MNTEEQAKQLLAGSYLLSAERIGQALQGALAINNSRDPSNPPLGNSQDVVGLCGQGGRHPYFRVPVSVLQTSITRIAQVANSPRQDPALAIEAISTICRELRQQTYFDTGTGCVNDQLPSMVPLLPPEEIWLGDRELPLDVWRLIAFEFDLVSTAVSSQTPVDDFAFSSLTQSALAFRYTMSQLGNQIVRFRIIDEGMPAEFKSMLGSPCEMEVSAARLFFEAGALLTPLAEQNFTKWYPAFRYMHWLSKSDPEFRVREEFRRESVDSRYRGLFAEEMGIGMMAAILGDKLQAKPISNTSEVLAASALKSNGLVADFIAQGKDPRTGAGVTIIAESKGSLGQLVSKTRQKHAKDQVAATNVHFAGSTKTLPLAFGSTIYFKGQKKITHCLVSDPPPEPTEERLRIDPEKAWRVAYAKALRFVGLEVASRQVFRGDPAEGLRPIDLEREGRRERDERDERRFHRVRMSRERYGADVVLDVGDNWGVSINSDVLRVLQHGIREGIEKKLEGALDEHRDFRKSRQGEATFSTSIGIGCVFYPDLDRSARNQ